MSSPFAQANSSAPQLSPSPNLPASPASQPEDPDPLEAWDILPTDDPNSLKWHVLQTKSRQEKALAESLSTRQIRCFLPIATVNRDYGGRRVKVGLPLFPGYLFLQATLEQVYLADRTKRVARIIPVHDQLKLHKELQNIDLALRGAAQMGAKFDPFPFLKRGIRVEVTGGPLKGVRGVIENRLKRDRLILQVDVLGQSTSVEVDGALVTPLE